MVIAYRSATSATDLAPAEPAGAAADDIILAVYSNEAVGATLTPATGFTQINYDTDHGSGSGVGQHWTGWARRGGSAIASNWSDGGAGGRVCLICFSGCKTSGSPINASSYAEGLDSTIEHATITTTVDNCMIVGLSNQWSFGSGSSTAFSNERVDQGEAVFIYDDGLLATAGATGSLLVTSTGSVWGATLVGLEPVQVLVPEAPTVTFQAGGHTRAGIQWTAGDDGGSAVTDWDIDAAPESSPTSWIGVQATSSTLLYGAYTGLTNGTPYVFRVRAVNAIGDGAWSSTSTAATPSDVRGFFLLEDGTSKFLLEDGTSKFLLESGAGAGGTDATATPASIAATVAMNAATLSAGSTPTPASITAVASLDAATASAGSTTAPTTIVATAALDAATLSAGSTLTPAAIVATVAVDTPTLSAGATPTPTEIVAVATIDPVTAGAAAVTTPATIVAAVAMDATVTSAGSTTTPATIVAAATLDTPTLAAGSTPTPVEIVAAATMDAVAATGSGEATATPAAVAATVTIDTPTLSAGATRAVAELVAVALLDAVATTAGGAGTPATIIALAALDTPTPSASSTVAPVTIIAVATRDPVTASGESNATAQPGAIVAVVTIDPVTASGNGIIAVILIDRIDIWTEPGPATWSEPAMSVWSEPVSGGWDEPDLDVWSEPAPTEGASL